MTVPVRNRGPVSLLAAALVALVTPAVAHEGAHDPPAPTTTETRGEALVDAASAIAPTPTGRGYWVANRRGGVFAYGDATFAGSADNLNLNSPIVGMDNTPTGRGYWLVGQDGGIFSFGDAAFYGSTGNLRLNKPVVGMAATPSGRGYWFVASDGGIFAYGDAGFHGSTGSIRLNQPVVGMAATPTGRGYWLVASDGGIFAFGDARFSGSTGSIKLNQPVVGMASTPSGEGYWFVAADGGIFSFGDAGFLGSPADRPLPAPVVGFAATPLGRGYWVLGGDGSVYAYGDAFGGPSSTSTGSTSYSFLATNGDGSAIRYNPCDVVHYVVNPHRAPPGGVEDVHEAFRRIAAATGMSFVYDGTTTELPVQKRPSYDLARYGARFVPVLVAWLNPGETNYLPPGPAGVGGSTYTQSMTPGKSVYITGQAALNAQLQLAGGFGAGSRGALLLHELGHVIGLGHVVDSSQVMYTALFPGSPGSYQAGDRTGLALLGRDAGCLTPPPPQPLMSTTAVSLPTALALPTR